MFPCVRKGQFTIIFKNWKDGRTLFYTWSFIKHKLQAQAMAFMYFNLSINWTCRSNLVVRWPSVFDSNHLQYTMAPPDLIFPVATGTLSNYFCPQLQASQTCLSFPFSSFKPLIEKLDCGRFDQNWNVLYEGDVKSLRCLKGTWKDSSSVKIFPWD